MKVKSNHHSGVPIQSHDHISPRVVFWTKIYNPDVKRSIRMVIIIQSERCLYSTYDKIDKEHLAGRRQTNLHPRTSRAIEIDTHKGLVRCRSSGSCSVTIDGIHHDDDVLCFLMSGLRGTYVLSSSESGTWWVSVVSAFIYGASNLSEFTCFQ